MLPLMKANLHCSFSWAILPLCCVFTATGSGSAIADLQKDGTDDAAMPFYEDLSGDGTVDTLHTLWNQKRVVVVDEGSDFLPRWQAASLDPAETLTEAFSAGAEPPVVWNPLRANWGSYLLLADNDGDGEFSGKADFYYRIVDLNQDGSPDLEYFCANTVVETMVNLNGERDFKHLNFAGFGYGNEHGYAEGGRYFQNVHGSGFFLNTRIHWGDVSLAWETPIAWYDFNHDGFTEMVMRIADEGYPTHDLQGQSARAHEAEFAFELNGELSREKWHSLDCQLTYTAYWTPGLSLTNFVDDIVALPAPAYARKFFGPGWEQMAREDRRFYLPYLDGYKIATDFDGWIGTWWLFDEDNDDNRWEEMFARNDKYSDTRIFSDKLGDRVEHDTDFDGKGQLYIGAFDGRIHLYRADEADWNVDYYGHFKGAIDRSSAWGATTDEGPEPGKGLLHDLVRYHDTDGNGFIDRIEYGLAEYGNVQQTWRVNRTVNLLTFANSEHPHPDVQPLFNLRVDTPMNGWKISNWDGEPILDWSDTAPYEAYRKLKKIYEQLCARQWLEARMLYDTAVSLGLNVSEHSEECAVPPQLSNEEKAGITDVRVLRGYASLTAAAGLREKYHHGYWLKEKVLLDLLDAVEPERKAAIQKLFYTGRIPDLCKELQHVGWASKPDPEQGVIIERE
jgi:hypothetical protein